MATSPSESDDALPRALENEAILELAWAPKLTRSLETRVATPDESDILSISLVLNEARSMTVKVSSVHPRVDLKNLLRPTTNRAGALLCDCAMHVDAGGEPANPDIWVYSKLRRARPVGHEVLAQRPSLRQLRLEVGGRLPGFREELRSDRDPIGSVGRDIKCDGIGGDRL